MGYLYNDPIFKIRRQFLRNNMTKPEQMLWYWLKNRHLNGYKFRRQYSLGPYILDFYCPKLRLAIEIDGDSHFTPDAIVYDKERTHFLEENNIRILRFKNNDVLENLENVINNILQYLP